MSVDNSLRWFILWPDEAILCISHMINAYHILHYAHHHLEMITSTLLTINVVCFDLLSSTLMLKLEFFVCVPFFGLSCRFNLETWSKYCNQPISRIFHFNWRDDLLCIENDRKSTVNHFLFGKIFLFEKSRKFFFWSFHIDKFDLKHQQIGTF